VEAEEPPPLGLSGSSWLESSPGLASVSNGEVEFIEVGRETNRRRRWSRVTLTLITESMGSKGD